jgi:hypothetical protein
MATIIHQPPQTGPRCPFDQGHSGNGGWRNLVPADGGPPVALEYSPPPSSTAIWVVLFAVVDDVCRFHQRSGGSQRFSLDWQTFKLPSILYFNTLLLLASSVTLEVARRRVAFMGGIKMAGIETTG